MDVVREGHFAIGTSASNYENKRWFWVGTTHTLGKIYKLDQIIPGMFWLF